MIATEWLNVVDRGAVRQLSDGQLIGQDFYLYDDAAVMAPATQLEDIVVTGRLNVEGQVNRALNQLGVPLVAAYDGFIQTLARTGNSAFEAATHPVATFNAIRDFDRRSADYIDRTSLPQFGRDAWRLGSGAAAGWTHGLLEARRQDGVIGVGAYLGNAVGSAGAETLTGAVGGRVLGQAGALAAAGRRGPPSLPTAALGRVDRTNGPQPANLREPTAIGACFVAGTLVHTPSGLKPIESLSVGDQLLSQPELTGEIAWRRINETFVFDDKPVLEIVYRTADGHTETLTATPNHPFWVTGEGWTAAELLEPGRTLELHDRSEAQVISVIDHGQTAAVYNFEVDGFHTYYVGEAGVWVHNTNCVRENAAAGDVTP